MPKKYTFFYASVTLFVFIIFLSFSSGNKVSAGVSDSKIFDLNNFDSFTSRFDGPTDHSTLGFSSFTHADINSDGFEDLIIGAPGSRAGGKAGQGSVYILLGPLELTEKTVDLSNPSSYSLRIDGSQYQEGLSGNSLLVSDLDSNGKPDLAIGASNAVINGNPYMGAVYLIENSILNRSNLVGGVLDLSNPENFSVKIIGNQAYSKFGYTLAAGDVDRDNLMDLAVSASDEGSADEGALYLFTNKIIPINTTGLILNTDNSSNYSLKLIGNISTSGFGLGQDALKIENIIGDEFKDLIVGSRANYNNKNNSGAIFIIDSLKTRSLISNNGVQRNISDTDIFRVRIDGASTGDLFGFKSIAVGDLNNDGKKDLIAGSFGADNSGRADSGSIYIIENQLINPGTSTAVKIVDLSDTSNYSQRIDGARQSDMISVGGIKIFDYDNDIFPDILLGSLSSFNNRTNSGSVYLVTHKDLSRKGIKSKIIDLSNENSFSLRFDNATEGDQSMQSYAVGDVFDVDGDKSIDLLISAPLFDRNYYLYSQMGALYVISRW